jgi:hypothetical protein
MEQDYPEELGQVDESTLEERLSLCCDSLVKAGVAAALKDHLSQLDNQLSLLRLSRSSLTETRSTTPVILRSF